MYRHSRSPARQTVSARQARQPRRTCTERPPNAEILTTPLHSSGAGLLVSLPPPQSEAQTQCLGLTFCQCFSISARTQDTFPIFSPPPFPMHRPCYPKGTPPPPLCHAHDRFLPTGVVGDWPIRPVSAHSSRQEMISSESQPRIAAMARPAASETTEPTKPTNCAATIVGSPGNQTT